MTYLERLPRADPNALLTILDFVGKKGVPLENFVDHTITDPLVREGFIEKPYKK